MKSATILVFFLLSALFVFTRQSSIDNQVDLSKNSLIKDVKSVTKSPVSNSNVTNPQNVLYKGYYYGQIFIAQERTKQNVLIKCHIERISKLERIQEVINMAQKKLKTTMKPITLKKFNLIMKKCDALDNKIDPKTSKLDKTRETTKWCTGIKVNDYHDLGSNREMDRCCREHSLCPIKIESGETRYNLTNNEVSAYHCSCERKFRNCLKASNKLEDDILLQLMKNFWFKTVKYCIAGIPGQEALSFQLVENEK